MLKGQQILNKNKRKNNLNKLTIHVECERAADVVRSNAFVVQCQMGLALKSSQEQTAIESSNAQFTVSNRSVSIDPSWKQLQIASSNQFEHLTIATADQRVRPVRCVVEQRIDRCRIERRRR